MKNSKSDASSYFYKKTLNGVDYNVYSHSYLCWGSDRAFELHQAQSVNEQLGSATILSACLPKGYSLNFTEALQNSYCVNNVLSQNQFSRTVSYIKKKTIKKKNVNKMLF